MDRRVVFLLLAIIAVVVAVTTRWPSVDDFDSDDVATVDEAMHALSPADAASNSFFDAWRPSNGIDDDDNVAKAEQADCATFETLAEETFKAVESIVDNVPAASIDALIESNDPDLMIAAYLVQWDQDREASTALMDRTLQEYPQNTSAIALALFQCAMRNQFCARFDDGLSAIPDELTQDMSSLTALATYLTNKGDKQAAIEVLEKAAVAPNVTDGFVDITLLLDRGLAASTGLDGFDRISGSFNTASRLITFDPVHRACGIEPLWSEDWLRLCIRVAERIESTSNSGLQRMNARYMLASLYKQAEATKELSTTQARRSAELSKLLDNFGAIAKVMLERDEVLMREWVDQFDSSDDVYAVGYLVNEVERRVDTGAYSPIPLCEEDQ